MWPFSKKDKKVIEQPQEPVNPGFSLNINYFKQSDSVITSIVNYDLNDKDLIEKFAYLVVLLSRSLILNNIYNSFYAAFGQEKYDKFVLLVDQLNADIAKMSQQKEQQIMEAFLQEPALLPSQVWQDTAAGPNNY